MRITNSWFAGIFLAATVVVFGSGCSTSKNVAPHEKLPPIKTTPIRTNPSQASTQWGYCEKDCQQPTEKSYRLAPPPNPSTVAAPVVSQPVQVESVAPVPAPKTINISSDVLFEFDSARIASAGGKVLDELGAKLKEGGPKTIRIIGYADRIGSEAHNKQLSEQRAQAVKGHLGSFAEAAIIQAEGRGKDSSITNGRCQSDLARSELIQCLSPDRRVEIVVTGRF